MDWWVLIAIAVLVLISISGGSGSSNSSQPQTRGEIRSEMRQDAQQAYEEQDYRGE
jgi:hypothetical protein